MSRPSFEISNKKTTGAGSLSAAAAQQLGPRAQELRRKKAAEVDLPKLKTEELEPRVRMRLMLDEAKKMKGEDPCWKGYEMVGSKKKGGKTVPNCVPEEVEILDEISADLILRTSKEAGKRAGIYAALGDKEEHKKKAAAKRRQAERLYTKQAERRMRREEVELDEKAPPGAKYERMVKHIKNKYAKDGLTDKERAIAFATAWKSYNTHNEEYLLEKARGTRKKTTVHAYDVDETLFSHGKKGKPNVKVHVNDASGKRVKSLSNQEFNTHKLEKGHSYDFGEFQSAKKFTETSAPNKKVVKHIQKKVSRGENVHLITARSKFDNPKEFHGHLKKHGIDVPLKNIHYTGGMKGGDIGDKKVAVANAIAKKHGATKTHMYDDAAKVHKSFEAEKKNKPVSKKIKTHLIQPDKSGESNVRSYQAKK